MRRRSVVGLTFLRSPGGANGVVCMLTSSMALFRIYKESSVSPIRRRWRKTTINFIGIPIRQLFASPANIARSIHYAQYLRQAHSNQGTSRACTGGQSTTTVSGRWQRSEMARHVTNFVGTSTIRAEMDEREDVSSSGGRCHYFSSSGFCCVVLCGGMKLTPTSSNKQDFRVAN
jgi:hypothetical protein